MKQYYYSLALSLVITLSIGQSKHRPKFHLSAANLDSLVLKKQAEFKKKDLPQDGTTQTEERFINFNPVLLDTKKATALKILSDLGDLSHATVFTIYQSDIATTEQELWSVNSREASIELTTTNAIDSDQLANYTGGQLEIPALITYFKMYKPRNKKSFNGSPFIQLGSFSNNAQKEFKGQIAEILVYNNVLRGKARQSTETYLALKYGISLTNGKDYLSSDIKVIYDLENRQGFGSRIAGIGKDSTTGLNQKQSHSTEKDNLITIGVDEIALSNATNKSVIADNTFLVWGDNNAQPTLKATTESSNYPALLQRQWMMQTSGATASNLTTTVQLDITTVFDDKTLDPSKYLLVMDSSGKGTFLPENVKYLMANSLENTILTFKNVQWDMDHSGADSFSFALKPDLQMALAAEKPINCVVGNNGVLSYSIHGGIPPYTFELKTDKSIIKSWKSTDSLYPENKIAQLAGANYTLTTTDLLQAKKEATYDLVNPLPIAVDLGTDKRFNSDQQEMTLDATVASTENISYQWTSDTGFASDAPKVSITTPGTYTVTVSTSKGCSATDSILVKSSSIKSFVLYPNESTDGNFNIEIALEKADNFTIQVFDLTGKLISTMKENNKVTTIVAGKKIESKGIFNIVFQNGTQKESRLLIVK